MSDDSDAESGAIHRWIVEATKLPAERVRWEDARLPPGMQPPPRPSVAGGPWASIRRLSDVPKSRSFTNRRRRVWSFGELIVTSVAANDLMVAGHPLHTGDGPLRVVGAVPPGGLVAGRDYWAIRAAAGAIRLAPSFIAARAGAAIALSSSGELPITLVPTAITMRAGREVQIQTRGGSVLSIMVQCYGEEAYGILKRLRASVPLPNTVSGLRAANVGIADVAGVVNVGAAMGTTSYESRASVTIRLNVVEPEETATLSIFERVKVTPSIT